MEQFTGLFKDLGKEFKKTFKPYEGFQKAVVKEGAYFALGISLEAPKGLGWKGALFIWPFAIAIIIGLLLLVRVVTIVM